MNFGKENFYSGFKISDVFVEYMNNHYNSLIIKN